MTFTWDSCWIVLCLTLSYKVTCSVVFGAGFKVLLVLHGIGDGSGGIFSSCWEV